MLKTRIGCDLSPNDYDALDACIPGYDRFQEFIAAKTHDLLIARKHPKIIHMGCGTGATTAALAVVLPNATIYATDNSAQMLTVAAQRLAGFDNVKFSKARVSDLPPSLDFDAVILGCFTHDLPPHIRRRLYSNGVGRLVRQDGLIIIGDKIAEDDTMSNWRSLIADAACLEQLRNTERASLEVTWIQHLLYDYQIRLTETEQRALFVNAGCHNIVLHIRCGSYAFMSGIKTDA